MKNKNYQDHQLRHQPKIDKKSLIRSGISLILLLLVFVPLFVFTRNLNNTGTSPTDKPPTSQGDQNTTSPDIKKDDENKFPDETPDTDDTNADNNKYELPIIPAN